MDADTGLVLAQQNMNKRLHPASITKVMTLGLACQQAQGQWEDVSLTVSHEDVYSLAGTDSSHIALQVGEQVPLTDALYATMMASANDGANLLAEYFGGGTIAGGVAEMNAQVEKLGLKNTHFANPHGISADDHYTSCYDMAQILRWALTQPGFETVFTRREMYTMEPTNIQPVTRYFSQQDAMRIGSSRYSVPSIQGSKIGYTNIARYSYVCLAEQNGVRLICVTMESQLKPDKYRDVKALLDYAFSTWTSYTPLAEGAASAQLTAGWRRRPAGGGHGPLAGGAAAAGTGPDSPGCNGGAGASRTLSAGRTARGHSSIHRARGHSAADRQHPPTCQDPGAGGAAGAECWHRAAGQQGPAAPGFPLGRAGDPDCWQQSAQPLCGCGSKPGLGAGTAGGTDRRMQQRFRNTNL